jgi:hypothetical protein
MSNIPMTWAEPQRCCTTCKETKPLTEFYRQKGGRDAKCKTCRVVMALARKKTERVVRPTIQSSRETEAIGRELFGVFRTWQGGEPRTDWRADMGLVCWPMEWQALA